MFQRPAFLGQVRIASPLHRPPAFSRRLGGMLEDYNNEINALKDKLSRLRQEQQAKQEAPFKGQEVYHPPQYPPAPPPPPPPPPLFPPQIVSGVDMPGTGMPPISVAAGDEVPPPVPTLPPAFPGGHAPVSTGIPFGEEGHPPYSYPPEPTQEQLEDCPRDTVWAAPGDSCPEGMEKTVPGSNCCYKSVASVSPRTPSFYPPVTGFQGTVPVDLTTSAQNFSNVAFGAEGAMTAPSFAMSGRRRYPVVNLRHPRRI